MKEFEKNILKFSDLMNDIWKKREVHLSNVDRAIEEWADCKIVILNSKILEHILTTSLKSNKSEEIQKLEDGYKKADGTVKMKLMKNIVDKMGCLERPTYYLSSNGNTFHQIPSREFFRKYYDDIDLLFDYHVKFERKEEEELNDFNIKIKLIVKEQELLNMSIIVKFSGGEFTNKLSAKYKFDIPENFNYLISKIEEGEVE
jgi:hypothetical protein